MKLLETLWAQMHAQGFDVDPATVKLNGEYTRFYRGSSNPDAWLRIDYSESLNYARANYGDWKTDESFTWDSGNESPVSEEQSEKIRQFLATRQKELEETKRQEQDHAKTRAGAIWPKLDPSGKSPYFTRKMPGSASLYGCRVDGAGNTFVPLMNSVNGSLQLVATQIIRHNGDKSFSPGALVEGSFAPIYPEGKPTKPNRVFIAEGIATAASIWEAFGGKEFVVSGFNAGNLKHVVRHFKTGPETLEVIVCSDEDILTKRKDSSYNNVGRIKAFESGADWVVFPPLTESIIPASDFNDVHVAHGEEGLRVVKDSIEHQLSEGYYEEPVHLRDLQGPGAGVAKESGEEPQAPGEYTGPGPDLSGVEEQGPGLLDTPAAEPSATPPGEEGTTGYAHPGERAAPRGDGAQPSTISVENVLPPEGKDRPKKPTQQWVALTLQARYGRNLIKSGVEVFKWVQTHWQLCEDRDHDRFFNEARGIAGPDFKAHDVAAAIKFFLKHIPHVPPHINLFEARPERANFLNGTLHLSFRPKTPEEVMREPGAGTHWFSTEFTEHRREDFCVNVIPIEYKPHAQLPRNESFEKMLTELWPAEDPEQAVKIRLYKQVLGAALVPIFPMLFFFLGQRRTGKSTALILIRHLIDNANVSKVDPTKWKKEFYLEDMAGKLANIVTDISEENPLGQDVVKLIIDHETVQINRKGKKTVNAKLPAFHAFGANEMPPTINANSGVYDRRIIIVKTDTPQPGSTGGSTFASWVWNQGREGVLKAALEGLEDLLANGGLFTEPASSKAERSDWLAEGDLVTGFVQAIEDGEVRLAEKNLVLALGPGLKIGSGDLFQTFLEWKNRLQIRTQSAAANPQKEFGRRFAKAGKFHSKPIHGGRFWTGVGFDDKGRTM